MLTRSQVGNSPPNEVRWSEVVGLDLERWAWKRGNRMLELNLMGGVILWLWSVLLSQVGLKISKGLWVNMTHFSL